MNCSWKTLHQGVSRLIHQFDRADSTVEFIYHQMRYEDDPVQWLDKNLVGAVPTCSRGGTQTSSSSD